MKKVPKTTTGRRTSQPAEASPPNFEAWAIVEIFGHQKYAGKISEFAIGGCNFIRVDVPELPRRTPEDPGATRPFIEDAMPAFTKLFGNGAVYSITLVSEAVARAVAAQIRPEPLNVYIPILAAHRQLAAGDDDDERYS